MYIIFIALAGLAEAVMDTIVYLINLIQNFGIRLYLGRINIKAVNLQQVQSFGEVLLFL